MRRLLAGPAILLLTACGLGDSSPHSPAADDLIAHAKTPEERAELIRVRDEIDAAARKRIRELDDEIARLERENSELRKR